MAIQPRAAATRQKLIDAAARLFADNGYLETTPKDVAVAADLTTGAFYYHFGSKEELAGAIIDQGWPTIARILSGKLAQPEAGIETVIDAEFALFDALSRDKLQWIGFHLTMAIGHQGPSARREYRKRVETFATLVPNALRVSDLRDGITPEQAAELLWIASTGAQLMSDALEETGPVLFTRLAMSWKSALRTIVPEQALPRVEAFVDETAARYGALPTETPLSADRVA